MCTWLGLQLEKCRAEVLEAMELRLKAIRALPAKQKVPECDQIRQAVSIGGVTVAALINFMRTLARLPEEATLPMLNQALASSSKALNYNDMQVVALASLAPRVLRFF